MLTSVHDTELARTLYRRGDFAARIGPDVLAERAPVGDELQVAADALYRGFEHDDERARRIVEMPAMGCGISRQEVADHSLLPMRAGEELLIGDARDHPHELEMHIQRRQADRAREQ